MTRTLCLPDSLPAQQHREHRGIKRCTGRRPIALRRWRRHEARTQHQARGERATAVSAQIFRRAMHRHSMTRDGDRTIDFNDEFNVDRESNSRFRITSTWAGGFRWRVINKSYLLTHKFGLFIDNDKSAMGIRFQSSLVRKKQRKTHDLERAKDLRQSLLRPRKPDSRCCPLEYPALSAKFLAPAGQSFEKSAQANIGHHLAQRLHPPKVVGAGHFTMVMPFMTFMPGKMACLRKH